MERETHIIDADFGKEIKKVKLKHVTTITILLIAMISACSSQKSKIEKNEMSAASDARITLTKKYTKCVTDAGSDTTAIEACDAILDSIKKLE